MSTPRTGIAILILILAAYCGGLSGYVAPATASAPAATSTAATTFSRPASLPSADKLSDAIDDWVGLLEKDDVNTAVERWAADAASGQQLAQEWKTLRQLHERYDYRTWLAAARSVKDGRFTVGGHGAGFTHIEWNKTARGWRIIRIWHCR